MERIMTFQEYEVFNEGITIGDELAEVKRKLVNTIKNIGGKQIKVKNIALGLSIAGLIYVHGEKKVNTALDSDTVTSVASKENVTLPQTKEIKDITKEFRSGSNMNLSKMGSEMIKKEESLRLTAYTIDDGMVTVGWGHAEKLGKTKRKKGDKITIEEAEKLFEQDIETATEGVQRIFKGWEERGLKVPVTQNQFDVLVSLAFNSGVGAVRRSEVIKKLKNGDYSGAAEKILTHQLGRKKHQEGIKKRRKKEAKVFMEGY